ncbi:hypothetical protein EJV47_14395 [Hymenobacter gummosus]|uniref:Uncharacterized protein n=1 Tax=Hymenobacter gummosus TaxID=1776032 RepID=A0A3S0JGR4_9BACT|nr:hypothetical protein [Hymenobacter gummosus]RTQ49325.1 hypothetical protein EJV47_14395 [Hymenobacter gummosus]
MPLIRQLQWQELDVLQGLEGVPVEDANGGLHFRVRHEGLMLLVSLWSELGMVDLTLVQTTTEAILLDLTVAVRGRIRYNNDKRGQYLEFADCVLVNRLTLSDEQLDAAFSPNLLGRTLLLSVKPHISLLFE